LLKEDGTKYEVLLVDDSKLVHIMGKKILTKLGLEVVATAKNGKEGIEKYKEHHPDLVMMDVTMPVMDGLEASEKIMEYDMSAEIIMLSAMADDDIKEQANFIGIDYFLQKPLTEEKVKEALGKIL